MSKRKTKFELETTVVGTIQVDPGATITIIGDCKKDQAPYVAISINDCYYFIQDKDLKLFAKNILKALSATTIKTP